MIAAEELLAALAAAGYPPRLYSGRGYVFDRVRRCVAVDLRDRSSLFDLGARLALALGQEIDGPSIDAAGHGVVAYWRRVEWPPGLAEPDDEGA